MGLETATYINQLVSSNPLGTDDRSQGDDHIRLVKGVLQNTFPNVTGAVTATHTELNAVAAPGTLCFPGMIAMWSGDVTTIPSGWLLCNGTGTISNGSPVPDLRSRFIVGTATNSGGTYNVGNTGGTADIVLTGSTQGTAITEAQMPPHTHEFRTDAQYSTQDDPANAAVNYLQGDPNPGAAQPGGGGITVRNYLNTKGGGQAHSHALNATLTNANLPPYYALAFIIKN